MACGKVVTGKIRVMKLKITSSKSELLESSKKLGFTSTTWQEGDFLQGSLHEKCFDMAIHIWAGGISHQARQPETMIPSVLA